MNSRKLIKFLIIAFVLIALVAVATPYVASLIPMKEKKSIENVRIEMAKIPAVGALEESHHGYRVLAVRSPEIHVFLLPYTGNAYLLPYPARDQPLLACENLVVGKEEISCINAPLPENWKNEARWDLAGKRLGKWMPDLQTAKYRIEGKDLVFTLEY